MFLPSVECVPSFKYSRRSYQNIYFEVYCCISTFGISRWAIFLTNFRRLGRSVVWGRSYFTSFETFWFGLKTKQVFSKTWKSFDSHAIMIYCALLDVWNLRYNHTRRIVDCHEVPRSKCDPRGTQSNDRGSWRWRLRRNWVRIAGIVASSDR